MAKKTKRYIIYFDTPEGLGEKVDYIEYPTRERAEVEVMRYKATDKICGNNNEYFLMEVEV